jgi:hypothetical protein
VDSQRLRALAACFDPPAEVIADYHGGQGHGDFKAGRDSVLQMIQRRPCSVDDIAGGLGMHRNEVVKYIEELGAGGLLEAQLASGELFYCGKHRPKNTND